MFCLWLRKNYQKIFFFLKSHLIYGALAQLGERVPCKDEAQGSSP